jgi:hypothetical protein
MQTQGMGMCMTGHALPHAGGDVTPDALPGHVTGCPKLSLQTCIRHTRSSTVEEEIAPDAPQSPRRHRPRRIACARTRAHGHSLRTEPRSVLRDAGAALSGGTRNTRTHAGQLATPARAFTHEVAPGSNRRGHGPRKSPAVFAACRSPGQHALFIRNSLSHTQKNNGGRASNIEAKR